MSKNSKLGCTALAILFVIVSVIVFVVPIEKTPAVWIVYAFTCVAFAAQIIIWKIGFKDKALKNRFLGIPIIRVGFIYLVLQLIALAVFFVIPKAPEWIVIIVCILILGISSVCMISSEIGRNSIENTEKKVDAKVSYIREIQADIEMCAERETDPEIKNQLLDLAEKVRYSDPMSSESLATIENKIVNKISELDTSDNKQAVIKEIDLLITERNKKAKMTK